MKAPEDGANTVSWENLPAGQYMVSARQASLSSEAAVITIDSAHRSPTIELALVLNTSRLFVFDQAGQAVPGIAFPMTRPRPATVGPGVYALDGISKGTQLQLRPAGPFVPICRVVPSNENVEVRLSVGQRVLLELRSDVTSDTSLVGVPGADCPVPLDAFHPNPARLEDGRTGYWVEQFPLTSGMILSSSAGVQRLFVSAQGTMVAK
jgi:hypothetical protein